MGFATQNSKHIHKEEEELEEKVPLDCKECKSNETAFIELCEGFRKRKAEIKRSSPNFALFKIISLSASVGKSLEREV